VYNLGTVKVNLIGFWRKGLSKPLWVMTTLEPNRGIEIYQKCMKIEQTFRDFKNLLGMTKLMNKQQIYMEKMQALLLLTFTVGLLIGEGICDFLYGESVA
jgi:hypothetical protein